MATTHRVLHAGVILLGMAWAACLVGAGLHALTASVGSDPAARWFLWLGVLGVAAGNFVFMEIVANRLVHPARRRFLDWLEFGTAALIIVSIVMSAMLWADGAGE